MIRADWEAATPKCSADNCGQPMSCNYGQQKWWCPEHKGCWISWHAATKRLEPPSSPDGGPGRLVRAELRS
jgi:hypothetical protein